MTTLLFSIPISWNQIHPVLVHFTTALLPVSVFSDGVGKYLTRYGLNEAAFWMLLYAAVATPLTAFAGWMWLGDIAASTGEKISNTLSMHRMIGIILTFCYLVLAVWRGRTYFRGRIPGIVYILTAALVTIVLFYQGYLGGKLTLG